MKTLPGLIVIFLLSLTLALPAQEYQIFSSENSSLPYNAVYCIDFDLDGNIWFGGQKDAATGLAFVSKLAPDLTIWTVYEQSDLELPEDRVFYMAVDDLNNIWMCTHYGVSVLKADGTAQIVDFTNDKYTRSVETDSKGTIYISQREDDRNESRIHVSEDHGENWVTWSLADLGFTLTEAGARPEIYDLKEDSQGQMWLCTWYGVTRRLNDGTWDLVDEIEGLYTYAMTIDKNDHVWVPLRDDFELLEILPDESIIVHDSTTIEPLKANVNDLEADVNGHIWCALDANGLLEILPDGSFNHYTFENTSGKLPENTLWDLEIHNDEIWIATETAGVVRISGLITTAVNHQADNVQPLDFQLHVNYPNPFNPSTTIRFDLAAAATIELAVFNVQGELVRTLAAGQCTAGQHQVTWNGRNSRGEVVSSGIYITKLSTGKHAQSHKMMFTK